MQSQTCQSQTSCSSGPTPLTVYLDPGLSKPSRFKAMPTTRGASTHGAFSRSASRKFSMSSSGWWVRSSRSKDVQNDMVRHLPRSRRAACLITIPVIRVPLKRETTSVAVQARQRAALAVWDRVRAVDGLGRWRVAYVGAGACLLSPSDSLSSVTLVSQVR